MKQEINLSESTPFIILCVIVASPSASSLGAFHLRTHTWGFSICFVVSSGKRSENWGTLQHWDMLLEAVFSQWKPFGIQSQGWDQPWLCDRSVIAAKRRGDGVTVRPWRDLSPLGMAVKHSGGARCCLEILGEAL